MSLGDATFEAAQDTEETRIPIKRGAAVMSLGDTTCFESASNTVEPRMRIKRDDAIMS